MVQTYSLKKDGNKKLAKNFTVKEFRSQCGSDEIKVDLDLIPYLQKLRECLGLTSMEVISGYRTPAYNKQIGGATSSQHLQGKAADIRGWLDTSHNKHIDPKYICCAAEVLGMPGIGLMQTAVHVDVRATRSWFDENKNNTRIENFGRKSWFTYCGVPSLKFFKQNPFTKPTSTDLTKLSPDQVRYVQFELVNGGYLPVVSGSGKCSIDGVIGTQTKNALAAYGLNVMKNSGK